MRVSLIAAMDRRGLIGDETGLPWHLPGDLRRFREYTWHKPIIMGRRTFELIGKPLPGRFNIVLTKNPDYSAPDCRIARTYQEGLSLAAEYLASTGGDEALIIGGSKVYAEAIHHWDRLYLTVVEGQFHGNAYFPVRVLLRQHWRQACEPVAHPPDEKNRFPHTFHIIERAWDSPHQGMDPLARSEAEPEKTLEELDLAAVLRRSIMAS